MRTAPLVPVAILIFITATGWSADRSPAPSPSDSAADQAETGRQAPITLDQMERLALANNPTLVQMGMRVRAAQGEYTQAGLYPNPVIGYSGDEIGDEGRAGQQGAFISQEIVTAGKLRLNRAVAAHGIQEAQFAWQSQRHRVLNDVRSGYYEALAAQEAVRLNRQLVQTSQEGVKTAERLLEAKEAARSEVLQARVETESAQLQLLAAENRLKTSWRQLVTLAGVPDVPPAPLAGSLEDNLPELAWESALARLFAESPELAGARTAVERARCSLARQCAQRYPNLDVETSVQYDTATNDAIAGVKLGVPLPIFNRNQGNIIKAQSQLAAAEQGVRRVELLLQNRLAAAYGRYENARQQAERYRKAIVPSAKESLELVRKGYQQGEFGYLNLLTAQRTYFRAVLAYLESLRELRTSAISIEGMLLSGGLQVEGEAPAPPEPATPEVPVLSPTP